MRRLTIVVAVALVGVLPISPVHADDDPHGRFGNVSCGSGRSGPGCGVTAGSNARRPARPASNSRWSGGSSSDSSSPYGTLGGDGCYYGAGSLSSTATRTCLDANGNPSFDQVTLPEGGEDVAIDPGALAVIARDRFVLPSPVIRSSPKPEELQLIYLPTWTWVERSMWSPRTSSASAGGVTVTATATPTKTVWSMGDGTSKTCSGPGTPYPKDVDPKKASPDCGHVYKTISLGQPKNAFTVTATISWQVTWSGGGAGGTLPPLTTTATAACQVAEAQSLVVPGGSL